MLARDYNAIERSSASLRAVSNMASIVGLFVLTAIPTVTGVAQAISGQKNQEERKKDERRMAKAHVEVRAPGASREAQEVNNGRVVLKLDRLWVGPAEVVEKGDYGYVAEAFYIEYPDKEVNGPTVTWKYC